MTIDRGVHTYRIPGARLLEQLVRGHNGHVNMERIPHTSRKRFDLRVNVKFNNKNSANKRKSKVILPSETRLKIKALVCDS